MYSSHRSPACRRQPAYGDQGRGFFPRHQRDPPPFRQPPYAQPGMTPHYGDRPPEPSPLWPNFVVKLVSDSARPVEESQTEEVIQKLKFQPLKRSVVKSNFVAAEIFYEQWNEALETVVQLWDMKLLDSGHPFVPLVVCKVQVPSDRAELDDRLRPLFVKKLNSLMEGYLVQKLLNKLKAVEDEIKKVSYLLKKPHKWSTLEQLSMQAKALETERDVIFKRIEEFKDGIKCIMNYLETGANDEKQVFSIFRFSHQDIDWFAIYRVMIRESTRLDDGLPIYAYRQDILKQIYSQQITVLIGETGSGKSTQLIQFLADSGIAGHESIICTQPRKLAASSLAERVREESYGCYEDTSVICCPSYSSTQELHSKLIFMTDNCLLQRYMSDKQLSGISCIIVDEAHERSLNTDLLLALIKNLLCQRPDLRLIIMSATADAKQFSNYFFGCRTFHVTGRNFPVEIKYVPCEFGGFCSSKLMPPYVCQVLSTVTEIHKNNKEGTVLAFLTSQMEVEWACENFHGSSAVALPLHGKLSHMDQHRVFESYPGKRKVIFATNVAETSLTIPGVKYVVDSGMVKECRFEPATGMSVLQVCRISQSSAKQRAGRAGRTEPGKCYRLYTKDDFESMLPHQEPEIRKVHLGIAILRILALGINNVQEFDFVDAPSVSSVEMAVRNLVQLGAINAKHGFYELTAEGWQMVKLGIEPRLGKLILQCFRHGLGRVGLVLAAVMANSSSIFCRVGTHEEKLKSDCLKVQFCHPSGDLFTLLSVYKEWEAVPREKRNIWCWENSINAKSMRRCQDTMIELENCLQHELNMIVPNYWNWNPLMHTERDKTLREIVLSSLLENVAMYTGCDQLGYEVASTKKLVQLHPSCSLLNFDQRPSWIVFGEILSVSNEYLVCVTACDLECLKKLSPPPFDFLSMASQQLQKRILAGFGSVLLKRFCGKFNSNLRHFVSSIRASCADERICAEVKVERNEILLYASSYHMEKVCGMVNDVLQYERKLLQNECLEKCLYNGGPKSIPSVALFGAGAEIKHLELEKRCLTVDVFHSNINALDDKELLMFLERRTLGNICAISRSSGTAVNVEEKKWGRVTFLTPDAAKCAADLKHFDFVGGLLDVVPSRNICGSDFKAMSFPSLRAKIFWPRRRSKGVAFVKCDPSDVALVIDDLSNFIIQEKLDWFAAASTKCMDSVVLIGLDKELSESDIVPVITTATKRKILDFFLLRGDAVNNPPLLDCEGAILQEISSLMPKGKLQGNPVHVQVFSPQPKDIFMRAAITFDGSLHLAAADALERINGKVLLGCDSWQKIRCQQLFQSSLSCTSSVYNVIRHQLDILIARMRQREGVMLHLEKNQNGSYRVKITAPATRMVAELRRPLEQLMNGKILHHPDVTPTVLQTLFSRGFSLKRKIECETGTFIMFDKYNTIVRVFGTNEKVLRAEQKLIRGVLELHVSKHLEVQLRGGVFPPDTMKRVVQSFGADLHGLKEKVPEAEFVLNTRRHSISVLGTKESKQKAESIILDLAQSKYPRDSSDADCPICLCDVEDPYKLEDCCHKFCRLCLVEQLESAIRSQDGFPLRCTREGCGALILLSDLRALLHCEKLEELFRASLSAFVASSHGKYRFCPSPDCPSVYRVSGPDGPASLFSCGACLAETCTRCHLEYHPPVTCEMYREFKEDPDGSLKMWCHGKENVKDCPVCRSTIEKIDGCPHIECVRCGKHVCWVCLEFFPTGPECYSHMNSTHQLILQ